MIELSKILNRLDVQLVIVIAATVLAYSNMLHNQFVIDDRLFVIDWQSTKSLKNIPSFFLGQTTPGTGHEGVYRPMRAVFYALSYQLLGSEPFFYHLQSLLVHLTVSILIYFVVWLMVKQKSVAFLSSLLFGLHPVHTEAVDYVTANFDAVGVIFFFGSLLAFLLARNSFKKNPIRYKLTYLASLLLAVIAFFSFEMTLTLPILIILCDICFQRSALKNFKIRDYLLAYGPYFIAAGLFLFIRVFLLHITSRGEYLGGSFYLTMLTMVKAVVFYFKTLILPINLSVNPTIAEGINSWVGPVSRMDKILSQSILDKDILAGLVIILALFVVAAKLVKKLPVISFSILWFFISILPVSYIIPQGPIAQDRYIYIASFGFCLLFAYVVNYLYQKTYLANLQLIIRAILALVLIIAFTSYFYLTYQRNKDWKDPTGVWLVLLKQIPNDVYTNYVVGTTYDFYKQDDLAILYYQKALLTKPNLPEGYLRLGNIYLKQAKFEQAQANYIQALSLYPDFPSASLVLSKLATVIDPKATILVNRKDGVWLSYLWQDADQARLLFFYPKDWQIEAKGSELIKLTNQDQSFKIEFTIDQSNLSTDNYLKEQTETYGNLVKQGLAEIPNVDSAYTKIWDDQGAKKQQFFLFKDTKVVRVLVYPGDSDMKQFDILLGSIVF